MKPKCVAVLLAEGFEEIEAITVIDVLRRADIAVNVTTLAATAGPVRGAHGIEVTSETCLGDLHAAELAMLVLPGGMPGSAALAANPAVHELARNVHAAGGIIAAICAAPIALQAAGLLRGRRVTCYPSFANQLEGAHYTGQTLEIDTRIITSRGPGTALVFALELVRQLGQPECAEKLHAAMLVNQRG